jgi:hypothetical protein
MEYLKLLIPAILTIIGNALFYRYIKIKSEQSIQKYSIAYSGIFMERIKVYRALLEKIFDLKLCIQEHIVSDKEDPDELTIKFNSFIRDCKVNEPLLSEKLSQNLNKLDSEFREIAHQTLVSLNKNSFKKGKGDMSEVIEKVREVKRLRDKLHNNKTLSLIESNLVNDMKEDFKVDFRG